MEEVHIYNKQGVFRADLMEHILDVRYTDLEEEKRACKQLLDIAEPEQDMYGCAFANVYLLDSCLALGEFSSCAFYLSRAGFLCREHGYDDLLMMMCNCAGLYYLKLNDEQEALDYYLEGLKAAQSLKNYDMEGKLLNNIGNGFGSRGEWNLAKDYFKRAADVALEHLDQVHKANVISYLCNLAESNNVLGDVEGAEYALDTCKLLNVEDPYAKLRMLCAWCGYYMSKKDIEKYLETVDLLVENGLLEYEQKYFVCDMCTGLIDDMIKIGEYERAKGYLDFLEDMISEVALTTRYLFQRSKINYLETLELESDLEEAYKEYYHIVNEMSEIEGKARSESMLSKIKLTNVMKERETMHKKNRELENAGQIDELTGLYNRRYFNKLISKVYQQKNLTRWGLVMLDIDYFKQYNDFYGHFKGDDALKAVASVLLEQEREGIYASRYGGDEFICLSVDLTDEELGAYVRDVYQSLRAKNIPHVKSEISDILTVSIGYSNEKKEVSSEELMVLADQALYRVKEDGRDGFERTMARDFLNAVELDDRQE